MKKTTLLLIMLLFSCSLFAQNTSSKEAREIKKRTLLVGLEELDLKKAKKLKGYLLEFEKNQIEGINFALKTAVEKYWSYNANIKYMPLSEAKELMKNSPKEYAVLQLFKYTDFWNMTTGGGWTRERQAGSNGYRALTYNPGNRYSEGANQIVFLSICMPNRVSAVNLPNLTVSHSDAVYGVMQMQYILNRLNDDDKLNTFKLVKECNGKYLKEKNLLLCKDDLDISLTEDKIKEVYPYNFKICTINEIDSAIINRDDKSVIVQIVSSAGGKGNVNIHFLADTKTGGIIGYIAPSIGFGIANTHLIKYNERIKIKQIKGYLEIANCK